MIGFVLRSLQSKSRTHRYGSFLVWFGLSTGLRSPNSPATCLSTVVPAPGCITRHRWCKQCACMPPVPLCGCRACICLHDTPREQHYPAPARLRFCRPRHPQRCDHSLWSRGKDPLTDTRCSRDGVLVGPIPAEPVSRFRCEVRHLAREPTCADATKRYHDCIEFVRCCGDAGSG